MTSDTTFAELGIAAGTVSGHSSDTQTTPGRAAQNGDATVTVTRNGQEIYSKHFTTVDARKQADAEAAEQKKKHPNATICN